MIKNILLIMLIITLSLPATCAYGDHFDTFFATNETGWGMLTGIFTVYSDVVGDTVFWGIFLAIPFLAMWVKQESVILPSTIMLITGAVLFPLIPPAFDLPIKMMLGIGVTGVLWHLFIKRR